MRTFHLSSLLFLLAIILGACDKNKNNAQPPTPLPQSFAKGADISWVTEMESAGRVFTDASGATKDCFQLMKELGLTAIRLRVWVNPTSGWCNTADVIAKAQRAKAAGLDIMIDLHYSDSWADPGQQAKPASWSGLDFTGLKSAVYNHTYNVLAALKAAGITPKWVQTGNETNDGMLWPDGKASLNMPNFAALINEGYNAIKAVDPSILSIVHLSNGYDNSLFRWLFDGLRSNGGKWDMIGMSLYPTASNWTTLNLQCLANINDMINRYNTDIMITEVGMSWDQPIACKSFLTDLITRLQGVQGGKAKGLFYWEPEAFNNWKGYTLGAFDNSGKPTTAMDAFR